MIFKRFFGKAALLTFLFGLLLSCVGMVPEAGTLRTVTPYQDTDSEIPHFTYREGFLRIHSDFTALPASSRPEGLAVEVNFFNPAPESRWIAVNLPTPLPGMAKKGLVDIRVIEDGQRDKIFKEVPFSVDKPLRFYLAAKAPVRQLKLELTWPRGFREDLHIELTDSKERPWNNLFIHRRGDFIGSHDGTKIIDGAIHLLPTATQGTYTSPLIDTLPFEFLVLSWNADTAGRSTVELEARALRSDGLWTEWLSWGKWGSLLENANAGGSKTFALMNDDIYTLRGGMGEEGIGFQYRAHLTSGDNAAEPVLRLVAASLRNSRPGRAIPKPAVMEDAKNINIDLNLPRYSQYLRDPQFASAICSPTSLTMVMEHFGTDVLLEEVVKLVYDRKLGSEGGYGNWSFNVAAAASYGFEAWVDFFGTDDAITMALLRKELHSGYPVIASVRYRNSASVASNLPLLDGAPIASTSGHLVVITGIFDRDGETWLIVNDSAAADDEAVRREYRADQFLQAWGQRLAYLLRPLEAYKDVQVNENLPNWQSASLEATGQSRDQGNTRQHEFVLRLADGSDVSLASQARSRYISISYSLQDSRRQYLDPGRNEGLWIDEEVITAKALIDILFTDGRQYKASIQFPEPSHIDEKR